MRYLVICWGQFLARGRLPAGQAGIGAVVTVTVTQAQSEKQAPENQHQQVKNPSAVSCTTEFSEILFIIDD